MKTLALAMITKNEAEKLRRCLESVKNYVDEIVVVDTGSEDNSVEVAREFTDKVYNFEWIGDFSAARNFSIEKVDSDYVLVLDTDEWIESMDLDKVKAMLKGNVIGIVSRNDYLSDMDTTDGYSAIKITRVFPKSERYRGKIHEQVNSTLKAVELPLVLGHDGYVDRENYKSKRNMDLLIEELKHDKTNAYYNFQLGKEYEFLKDYKNASKYFREAYKTADRRAPYFPGFICEYILCLKNSGYMDEGLKVVENEREKFIDYPNYLFNSALFYMELIMSDIQKYIGYLGLIETNYLTCIEIGETDKYDGIFGMGSYMAMHNLAAFYEAFGNNEAAVKYYKMAAEYDYEPSIERLKALGASK